jgi:hypothetical protein
MAAATQQHRLCQTALNKLMEAQTEKDAKKASNKVRRERYVHECRKAELENQLLEVQLARARFQLKCEKALETRTLAAANRAALREVAWDLSGEQRQAKVLRRSNLEEGDLSPSADEDWGGWKCPPMEAQEAAPVRLAASLAAAESELQAEARGAMLWPC